tara:strand:- start:3073 stop:4434 length:1362 start_codon:yes stop_codon:yes gene_type:complete
MAYAVNQSSTGLRGSYDDLVYVVTDTAYADPKYRYACAVIVDSAIQIILKQLPNNANAAVFDIQSIAAQFVKPDENPYQLGNSASDLLSTNTGAYKTVTVRFGYSSAIDADSAPTTTLDPLTDQLVKLVSGNFVRATDTVIESSPAADYIPDDASALFLSDAVLVGGVYQNYVVYETGEISWAALAFINSSDSSATYIRIQYFDNATLQSSTEIENSVANGGAPPSGVSTDTERLLYLGVGTGNLEGYTGQSSPANPANGGWTHYDITLLDGTGGNAVSATYRFNRLDCNRFQQAGEFYTVHWWNSKGGVDQLVFAGQSILKQSMDRNDFRQIGGNSFNADGLSATGGTDYVKYPYEGGKTQASIRTTTTLSLNTVMGTPAILSPLMMSLMNSERVYITPTRGYGLNNQESTATEPPVRGIITAGSFMQKTGVNDKVVSYSVEVEVARLRPSK